MFVVYAAGPAAQWQIKIQISGRWPSLYLDLLSQFDFLLFLVSSSFLSNWYNLVNNGQKSWFDRAITQCVCCVRRTSVCWAALTTSTFQEGGPGFSFTFALNKTKTKTITKKTKTPLSKRGTGLYLHFRPQKDKDIDIDIDEDKDKDSFQKELLFIFTFANICNSS